MNSGLGAIDNFNFDGDEWGNYDVRYILEVYEVTEGKENLNTPIKKREVQTYDQYQETMFSLRLVPNRDYRFVVWADFVNEDSDADLHYNTADLKAITRNKAVVAMDECQDAYFIQRDIKLGDKGLNETLELKRPFGKIRVITTDYDEVNIGSEPAKVTVQFYNHKLLTSLNAVTGVASGETSDAKYTDYIEYTVAKDAPYTQGYDSEDQNMTLFADYILAADDTVGAQEVNFKMTIWGQDGREIRTHDFNTQIPLERNHLTTIVGNLLTLDNEFTIKIDDNFDGEYIRDWDDEAVKIEDGQWGYGELNANGNYEFAIDNGAENFTLIVPQSAVNQTSGKLSPVGKAEFVASEAELEKNTFTITNFMVDATRAAEAATVTSGTMRASNWNDGVHVQFDLYYSFDPEADPAEYKNIRFEFKGDALAKTALATPVVAAAAVENVITLSWAAIEGAGSYAITNGTEMPVFVEECEYTFTGEYATEYTLSVVAVPADEAKNYPSEAGTVTATTEAKSALATPVVTYEINEGNLVTLSWEAIEGAKDYTATYGENSQVVEGTSATFDAVVGTLPATVVANPADEAKNYASEAGTVEVTVEAPVVEPVETVLYLQPNANWRVDNARFAAYFFGNGEAWADMTLVEGETNIYAVTVPAGFENIIFCRMSSNTTANNWTNRWNQTSDLKVPTDGTNLYTVAEGAWDNGGGTWSTYTPAAEPEEPESSLQPDINKWGFAKCRVNIMSGYAHLAFDGGLLQSFSMELNHAAFDPYKFELIPGTYTFDTGNTYPDFSATGVTVEGTKPSEFTITVIDAGDGKYQFDIKGKAFGQSIDDRFTLPLSAWG